VDCSAQLPYRHLWRFQIFNIHVDQTDDVYAVRFRQLLQSFGLVQHVNEPTHSAGHMLDLIITRTDTEVTDLHVGDMISDHDLRS